ncbi:hypothetical protein [Nitrosomonas sp. Is37]|uniref:hypothetical protein n=1 Tax=Nitrosomonas sp. Is37 TaxID=3080535 RepID=UPI00294AB824|nr:hypothetical protein [Nitrosomonas sp. Is37]
MSRFMLDRQVLVPPGYAERSCLLVKYRLPWLRHCFVLCHEPRSVASVAKPAELMAFFVAQAEQLALGTVNDPQAFMLVHSGASIRKRPNLHLHVFVVQHRWQKAWVYTVLGAKNIALAVLSTVQGLVAPRSEPNPSIERTFRGRLRRLRSAAHVRR